MQQDRIAIGGHYGFREVPRSTEELQHVRVLERARGKWKVEWIEPNAGLSDWVKSNNLVVAWADRKAFLRGEKRRAALRAVTDRQWPGHEHPISHAVTTVLDSTGERTVYVDNYGVIVAPPDARDRILARAHLEVPVDPVSYVDSRGEWNASFATALTIAKAFAAAEPQTVLLEVDVEERRMDTEAREPGNGYLVGLVQEYRAHWAICRQWAGFDQAIAQRDAEIVRLRRLLDECGVNLRRLGHDDIANRMERKLRNA
jgi:hypothetical protein